MATATREHLLVGVEPPSARITLNRPEKRNALSLALLEELIAALEEVAAKPEVRAIVIEGAGPAFSAGRSPPLHCSAYQIGGCIKRSPYRIAN